MLALAVATKQQGIFFLPLLVGLLWLNTQNARRLPQAIDQPARPIGGLIPNANLRRLLNQPFCTFLLTLGVGLLLPLVWDANRLYRPGFWLQSSLSYGGITPAISHVGSRLAGFIDLLRLVTDAPALNLAFGAGLPLLLAVDYRFDDQTAQPRRADGILAGFCLIFILLHALLSFQIWDRYLLGLVPFLALLLARVLHLPAICLKSRTVLWTVAGGLLVISLMGGSVRRAVEAGYPLGGDHGAFAGTAEIGLYLNQHVGANVTLYHRWLGAHWRYYLFNYPYDLHFWQSTADLAQQAAANAAGEQYIAFPAWQSTTPAQLALADVDLQLRPIFYTFRSDGAPAAILYKIEMRP
jgi:hypothetical protein